MDRSTIAYYNAHADEYAEKTRYVYMFDIRSEFLKYLDPDGRIADLGCGGGRDKKVFEENGYLVDACDASPEMCRVAEDYTGDRIQCCDIRDWKSRYTYSGIWCCASLLHLEEPDFYAFFKRIGNFLKRDGVLYFSMKKGIADGYDADGRYYLGFDEARLKRILEENPQFKLECAWETADNLKRDVTWINVILQLRDRN